MLDVIANHLRDAMHHQLDSVRLDELEEQTVFTRSELVNRCFVECGCLLEIGRSIILRLGSGQRLLMVVSLLYVSLLYISRNSQIDHRLMFRLTI